LGTKLYYFFAVDAVFPFQGTLPYNPHSPSHLLKANQVLTVHFHIPIYLVTPKFLIGRWPFEQMTGMSMPETAVCKNDSLVPGKYHVRFSREVPVMEFIPEAQLVKALSENHFRLRIFALDTGHHSTSFLR
jgi:hypothetical protein